MQLEQTLLFVPTFVLAFFRLAAMCLSAPLFGSARIPRRVKVMFALVLAMAHTMNVATPAALPASPWTLALGIGGEIIFGLAMGTALSFVFVAVHWAGEIIGQQMGLNISETIDPSMGRGGSLVGDMYFLMTLVIFLLIGGHRALIRGVEESFAALPLLTPGINVNLFHMLAGLLNGAMTLAIQLAAPMLVTALVVDLVLGFIGKTVPQLNVMAAGLSMRSAIGIVVLIVGLSLSSRVIRESMSESIEQVCAVWSSPQTE